MHMCDLHVCSHPLNLLREPVPFLPAKVAELVKSACSHWSDKSVKEGLAYDWRSSSFLIRDTSTSRAASFTASRITYGREVAAAVGELGPGG
jgi:hypothetical protein